MCETDLDSTAVVLAVRNASDKKDEMQRLVNTGSRIHEKTRIATYNPCNTVTSVCIYTCITDTRVHLRYTCTPSYICPRQTTFQAVTRCSKSDRDRAVRLCTSAYTVHTSLPASRSAFSFGSPRPKQHGLNMKRCQCSFSLYNSLQKFTTLLCASTFSTAALSFGKRVQRLSEDSRQSPPGSAPCSVKREVERLRTEERLCCLRASEMGYLQRHRNSWLRKRVILAGAQRCDEASRPSELG
jgi:hypothetical protein